MGKLNLFTSELHHIATIIANAYYSIEHNENGGESLENTGKWFEIYNKALAEITEHKDDPATLYEILENYGGVDTINDPSYWVIANLICGYRD